MLRKISFASLLFVLSVFTQAQDTSSTALSGVTIAKVYYPVPALSYPQSMSNSSPFNQYSSSAGFASYSAKGFANSFSYGINERIDSTENYSSIFNAPFGELLFNPLDISRIVFAPTIYSGNYGSSVSGAVDITSLDPFTEQKFSVMQQSGFNNLLGLYNRSMFRYAQAYGKKKMVALNVSGEFDLKREWQYDKEELIYGAGIANINLNQLIRRKRLEPYCPTCPVTQADHDKWEKLNNWLDFNPQASIFDTSTSNGFLLVPVQGRSANDFMGKYFRNVKANAGLHFRLGKQIEFSLAYRFAMFNTIVQPYFRYQLQNYTVHQPKAEIKGKDFTVRAYATLENSGNSYNIQRTAYRTLRTTDSAYVLNYTWNFETYYVAMMDTLTNFCADCIREWQIDSARQYGRRNASIVTPYPQKGSTAFDTAFNAIVSNTNPAQGSGFKAMSKTFFADAEYRFGFQKWMELAMGINYRLAIPENNEWNTNGKMFHDASVYLNTAKSFWKKRFTLFASGRFNYTTDYSIRGNYRAGLSFSMNNQTVWVASSSGYQLPNYAQRYMNLIDYAPRFYGNNFTQDRWYSYASVLDTREVLASNDTGCGSCLAAATLKIFEVTRLKPQKTIGIEVGTKNTIAHRIRISASGYFNWVENTQALAFLAKPYNDTIDIGIVGEESGINNILTGYYTPFITWTNLPVKTNSWGAMFSIMYIAPYNITPYFNYNYFGHGNISVNDRAILSFNDFNTPQHKLNVGVKSSHVWKGLGFDINFRWVSGYKWKTDFAIGTVPSYHTLDVSIHYEIEKIYSTLLIGGSNVYNNRHTEIPGSPKVGAWYYAAWRFDLDLAKLK